MSNVVDKSLELAEIYRETAKRITKEAERRDTSIKDWESIDAVTGVCETVAESLESMAENIKWIDEHLHEIPLLSSHSD